VVSFTDPAAVYARVCDWLTAGVASGRHPFHRMAVATTDRDGAPTARTVVVRGFDPAARTLVFHADARSPKVGEIARDPRVGLLLYDPVARVQVRTTATAVAHRGDDAARDLWQGSRDDIRAGYAAARGPGEVMGPDEPSPYPPPQETDDPFAFDRFVAFTCRFDALDVLELHPDGHRRVRLTWAGDGVAIERLAP
jgi:hypothetical protein